MSAGPIEKDVQVEDTRRVVVTFTRDAIWELVRREAGAPDGVDTEIDALNSLGNVTVIWEVRLNG